MKKLVGRTDLEDALQRLDKLTHEEARMATAQALKATHTVEERVRGVADTLLGVDDRVVRVEDGVTSVHDRVAGVDERVAGVDRRLAGVDKRVNGVDDRLAGVDNKVASIDDRVADVDNRVKGVNEKVDSVDERVKTIDDKVDEVVEGTQPVLSRSPPRLYLTLVHLDAKEGRAVTKQTAGNVDQVKSSSSPSIINAICAALPFLQRINCGRTFTNGYPHRIRLRTITSHVTLITKERRPGSSKEASSRGGCPRDRSFGFTVNVRPSRFPPDALR